MNRPTILAVGAALLLLVGAMPAVTAAAPTDAPNDTQPDDAPSVGPSDGLPGPVPDFVTGIHETITSFLSGDSTALGDSVSELLSDSTPAEDMRGGSGA